MSIIRESLCFDDLLMLPRMSTIKSRSDINLSVNIAKHPRKLQLNIPLISSPMDTVTGEKMAIQMALEGGLGIIHRFMSFEEQLQAVINVKRYIDYVFTDPYTIYNPSEYEDAVDKHGVKTFVVRDKKTHELQGLMTNRDFNKSTHTSYTNWKNLIGLYYTKEKFQKILSNEVNTNTNNNTTTTPTNNNDNNNNENDKSFEDFMNECNDLMLKNRVQKCPIFEIVCDYDYEYGNELYAYHKTNNLLGIVTLKSVEHYFNNKGRACLDNQGRLCVGAAVGIKEGFLDNVSKLVEVGVDCVCVDVANGHNYYTVDAVKKIRNRFPELVIMAGNVCTSYGFKILSEAGADCIRVGIGNGSICSTRLETGIGNGQWSSIRDCYFSYKLKNNNSAKIICDGGSLGKTGNKVKALAVGADAIILGRTLAGTIESPGTIIIRNGKRVKYFRGMASTMANISGQEKKSKRAKLNTKFTAEGVDGVVEIKGSVCDILNQISGGIRSGYSYLGVHNEFELSQIRNEIEWVQSTAIGLNETQTRIKTF